MSFAFDETYYLKSKLQQLIKTDAATYGSWSTDDVKDAIEQAGMTVEGHYQQYSLVEGTSGNPYFNTTEYLEAKLAQLKSIDSAQYGNWTVADVVKAFQDAGFTSAEDHYNQYGCKETDATGHLINPSNAFDANAYVQAKLAQLVAADPETYGEWTAQDVLDAIAEAGMTPVEHFEEYGKAEGQAAGVDMVQTVPVTQRVANDELRDGMDENVPSNYNKPVDAPKDVDASEAGSVDKPCDMATAAKPADPVAVPGDSAYVAVPGGGIEDTNANPVELVTATVTDDKGNVIASESQYGVATTKTENGVTTKTVQPVNSDGTVDGEADPIQTVTTNNSTGAKTTETKLTDSDGNTLEVKEEVVKNDDGSTTTTTTATETDKNDKVVAQTATVTEADATGAETGSTSTYTDANGNTSTTESGDAPEPAPTPEPTPTPTPGGGGSGTPADTTAPTLTKVEVADDNQTVTCTFSEDIKLVNGKTLDDVAAVTVDGNTNTVTDQAISGSTFTFKLSAAATAGQVVAVNIAADTVQDATGNKMPAATGDPVTIPATDSGEGLQAAFATDTLTLSDTAKGAVVVDATTIAASSVKDNDVDVTVTGGTNFTGLTAVNMKAAAAADGVAIKVAADLSALTVTTSDNAPANVAIANGTAAVNTITVDGGTNNTVTGFGAGDTVKGTGTTKVNDKLTVANGSVSENTNVLTISGTNGASYSGDLRVVDGLTSLTIGTPGTAVLDLSALEGFESNKLDGLTLNTAKVKMSADQVAALTPTDVSATTGASITIDSTATIDAGLLAVSGLAVNVAKGSTLAVTADADLSSVATFNSNDGKPFNTVEFANDDTAQTLTVTSGQFGGFGAITGDTKDKIVLSDSTFTIKDGDLNSGDVTISASATATVNVVKASTDLSAVKLDTAKFTTLNLGEGTHADDGKVNDVTVTVSTAQLKAFSLGQADTYDTIIAKDAITSGDSVTLTGGATFQLSGAGANTVTLGAGGVTVKAGAKGDTITSGAGADTITLGAGTDTVVFVASNGQDTVSGLKSGDKVNVHALSDGALSAATAVTTGGVDLADKALYTIALSGAGAFDESKLLGTDAIHTTANSGDKAIVVVDYTDTGTNAPESGVYVCAVSATGTTLDASMITTVGVFDVAAGVVAAALDGTALV